jgi:hypothetical protein
MEWCDDAQKWREKERPKFCKQHCGKKKFPKRDYIPRNLTSFYLWLSRKPEWILRAWYDAGIIDWLDLELIWDLTQNRH